MAGDLFRTLGRILGSFGGLGGGAAGGRAPAARSVAVYDPESGDARDVEDEAEDAAEGLLVGAAAAWLLGRVLRPRPVSWPRVIVAGVGAAVLADLVGRWTGASTDAGRGAIDGEPSDGRPFAGDPAELMGRAAAGIGLAAGYASIVYPRLPGPPLLRGAAFGALEIAAAPHGGLARLAGRAPGVKFPLQALALPVDEDAGPASLLAFGLGLGLLYRYDPRRDDDDDEDDDDQED